MRFVQLFDAWVLFFCAVYVDLIVWFCLLIGWYVFYLLDFDYYRLR